jgi:hypothetical protein
MTQFIFWCGGEKIILKKEEYAKRFLQQELGHISTGIVALNSSGYQSNVNQHF